MNLSLYQVQQMNMFVLMHWWKFIEHDAKIKAANARKKRGK